MNIIVHYNDGTKEEFPETSRPGGSWSTSYKIKDSAIIIEDAWNNQTIIPMHRVHHVNTY